MKNVIWTRQFNLLINGKPDWNKDIQDVLIGQMNNGVFCAGVLYYDEYSRKEDEAFYRLEQFVGADVDKVWEEMDSWVNTFTKGMDGYQYLAK